MQWVNNSKNGVHKESKETLLNNLRALAKALTEDEFQSSLTKLELSEVWGVNKMLQNWMSCTWLPEKKVSVNKLIHSLMNIKTTS